MAAHRFFLAGPLRGDVLPLTPGDLHHATRVARIAAGERIVVVEPSGRALDVRVTEAGRAELRAQVVSELPVEALPDVTVFFGMTKGAKAEFVVEKCTEVGVARLVPFLSERAVARPDDDRARGRADRLERIARAAAAQSQRAFVPAVEPAAAWSDVLARVGDSDRFLVAWEEDRAAPGATAALRGCSPAARVAVLVGPEGGLMGSEVDRLLERGAVTVSLGATILRAETAAVVLAALASAALGGLGESRDR